MRILRSLAVVLVVAAPVAVGSCYNPGDLGDSPFICTHTYAECPDGYTCDFTKRAEKSIQDLLKGDAYYCARTSGPTGGGMDMGVTPGSISIGKKTDVAPGPYKPSGLTNPANCPDKNLEPNNDFKTATAGLDAGGPAANLAICPAGDVDVFQIDLTGTNAMQYVRMTVLYDLTIGDLDIGILDATGKVQGADLSAQTNACAVSTKALSGMFYGVVIGQADGLMEAGTNRYTLQIDKSPSPLTCAAPMPDMGGDDSAF